MIDITPVPLLREAVELLLLGVAETTATGCPPLRVEALLLLLLFAAAAAANDDDLL